MLSQFLADYTIYLRGPKYEIAYKECTSITLRQELLDGPEIDGVQDYAKNLPQSFTAS